jgi:DNA-binding beta-propeller fold protein YncE
MRPRPATACGVAACAALFLAACSGGGGYGGGIITVPTPPAHPPGLIQGVVTTLAGGASTEKDGQGSAAGFSLPYGILYDSADGNLYVVDFGGLTLRRVTLSGVVSTVAGSQTKAACGGTGASAVFEGPWDLLLANNQLYVADDGAAICTVNLSTGAVTDIAGLDATPGTTDGTGTAARFMCPSDIAYVPSLNEIFVTDGDAIRTLDLSTLQVVTRAGSINSPGHADATGPAASFNEPEGITYDSGNNTLYIADSNNNEIRAMNPTTYQVSTVAGNLTAGFADGVGSSAQFRTPWGVAYNPADGIVYIGDTLNNAVRAFNPVNGSVTTIAGNGTIGSANGTGSAASFHYPAYMAFDPGGTHMYLTDTWNGAIRVIQ